MEIDYVKETLVQDVGIVTRWARTATPNVTSYYYTFAFTKGKYYQYRTRHTRI